MSAKFNFLLQERVYANGGFGPYSFAIALFFYSSHTGYSKITQSLKYHADLAAGRSFGAMLGERLLSCAYLGQVDAVVPVPLHWTRRWTRGYNQSEIIASEIAKRLSCAMLASLLKRKRRTKAQTKLDIEQKKSNVLGAFSVNQKVLLNLLNAGARQVLLVDDVFTTGATMTEACVVLRQALTLLKLSETDFRISIATLGFVG